MRTAGVRRPRSQETDQMSALNRASGLLYTRNFSHSQEFHLRVILIFEDKIGNQSHPRYRDSILLESRQIILGTTCSRVLVLRSLVGSLVLEH